MKSFQDIANDYTKAIFKSKVRHEKFIANLKAIDNRLIKLQEKLQAIKKNKPINTKG